MFGHIPAFTTQHCLDHWRRIGGKLAGQNAILVQLNQISGVLLSEGGPQVVRGVTGPYREGAAPLLRCGVRGGDPKPRITWWRDGVRLPHPRTSRYDELP